MLFKLLIWKRTLEDLFIFPFVVLGRLIGQFKRLDKEYEIFFFFPFFHIGGAETVHSQIARGVGNERCIIFFTRKSHNDLFYERFKQSGCTIRDISRYTDNKWLYFLNLVFRGILSSYINRQKKPPLVFNGQCNLGYKIAPWIKKNIPQVELIHSYNSFSAIRLPFIPFITRTVMISHVTIGDHKKQYQRLGVPLRYTDRIQYIMNGIPLSAEKTTREFNKESISVLYVGRGTREKRVHLIAEMARKMSAIDTSVHFSFVGKVDDAIPVGLHPYLHFYGNLNDAATIAAIYQNAGILMIVSDLEGFPMVIMEAMAYGCAIIATPVGDIPQHITNDRNGYLFSTVTDEAKIIEEGIAYILQLKNDPGKWKAISVSNQQYAYDNFSIANFNSRYRQLFSTLLLSKTSDPVD